MRISSAIDLAAIFTSPVSWRIFACGQANVLISSEASKRPALLTGLSCDINGICISLRVRIYAAMLVLLTSSCENKNNIHSITGPEGRSYFFRVILMLPETKSRKQRDSRTNKINCFPRDCYIADSSCSEAG